MRRYIVSGMSKVVLMTRIISYLPRRINMDLLIYGILFSSMQMACCRSSANLLEIRANGGECAVLHTESARDRAELRKAETFVEVPGVDVPFDDGVELKYSESMRLGLCEAIENELLAEMPPAAV